MSSCPTLIVKQYFIFVRKIFRRCQRTVKVFLKNSFEQEFLKNLSLEKNSSGQSHRDLILARFLRHQLSASRRKLAKQSARGVRNRVLGEG